MPKTPYIRVEGEYGSEYVAYQYPNRYDDYWTVQFDDRNIGVAAVDLTPLIELLKQIQKKVSK